MINSMQAAIIRKDIRAIVSNKRLFPVLLVVPLVFTVLIPSLFIFMIHFIPDDLGDFQQLLDLLPVVNHSEPLDRAVMSLILNNVIPVFFILIPVMAASVMAASAFVGEKEKRTLETLLYCPLTLRQIFQSKVWASFFLSMGVSVASFVVMFVVAEIEILLMTGRMLPLDFTWLVVLALVSPAISILGITLIVSGSAKAQTIEESQQRAVFLVLPVILIATGQFSGVILINAWYLLAIGAVLALVAYFMMKRVMANFTYEALLR